MAFRGLRSHHVCYGRFLFPTGYVPCGKGGGESDIYFCEFCRGSATITPSRCRANVRLCFWGSPEVFRDDVQCAAQILSNGS